MTMSSGLGSWGWGWGWDAGGGFSPLSITGCVLWLRADTISGLSDGDSVATWSDESGEGNDATEATNKPTYETNVQNGLAVVRFNGTDDELTTAGNIFTDGEADLTVFVVVANYTCATVARPIGIGFEVAAGQREFIGYNFDNATTHSIRFEGASRTFSQTDTDPSIICFMRDGYTTEDVVARFNGAEVLAAGTPTTDNILGNTIFSLGIMNAGADRFFACDIAEVIVYEAFLGSGNITLVEAYLNDKWSVY